MRRRQRPAPASRGLPPGASEEKDPKYPPVVSCTLSNGLRLLVLEKKFVPTASFTLVFNVGNVDNPQGKTGLAHMFEHMAFKGTKIINSDDYAKEKPALERVEAAALALSGEEFSPSPDPARLQKLRAELEKAQRRADALSVKDEYLKIYNALGENGLNAMTSTDYTGYVVSLPADRLEAWMAIESDRFKNPVLREFYREREVVAEERLMSDSDPNRLLWDVLMANAFAAHPYRNPTLGWPDDLARLARADAEEFYRTFYVPNNAALSVVGDVRPAEAVRLAEKYFGGWRPGRLPPRDYTKEPEQRAEKLVNLFFKASPALRIGFHNPGMTHPDVYPLIMAGEVLSGGKTGRFYRRLVEGKQLALYAGAWAAAPGSRYPSLFAAAAAPKAPHTLEELDAAVMEEIAGLVSEPPTRWELEKVVNNYEAELIKQLESNPGLGMSLAQNEAVMGDWRFDWKIGDELRRVKPEDVSAAVARYLVRPNRTAVFLREPPEKGAA